MFKWSLKWNEIQTISLKKVEFIAQMKSSEERFMIHYLMISIYLFRFDVLKINAEDFYVNDEDAV